MSESSSKFSQSNPSAFRNPWFYGWILLVVVVFTVNFYMVYMSQTTHPGLVDKHFYEKGKDYDEIIARRKAQENLGWQVSVTMPDKVYLDEPFEFSVETRDRDGALIVPSDVKLTVFRPSSDQEDFTAPVTANADGTRYSAELNLSLKGYWHAVLLIRSGDAEVDYSKEIDVLERRG